MTLLDDTIENFGAGARLAVLRPVELAEFRVVAGQASLQVVTLFFASVIDEYATYGWIDDFMAAQLTAMVVDTLAFIVGCWIVAIAQGRAESTRTLAVVLSPACATSLLIALALELLTGSGTGALAQTDWGHWIHTFWFLLITYCAIRCVHGTARGRSAVLALVLFTVNWAPVWAFWWAVQ